MIKSQMKHKINDWDKCENDDKNENNKSERINEEFSERLDKTKNDNNVNDVFDE